MRCAEAAGCSRRALGGGEFYNVLIFGGSLTEATNFRVLKRYTGVEFAYHSRRGFTCSALDSETEQPVLVTKLHRPFQSLDHASATLQELRWTAAHHSDPRITSFSDIFFSDDRRELFVVHPPTKYFLSDFLVREEQHPLSHGEISHLIGRVLLALSLVEPCETSQAVTADSFTVTERGAVSLLPPSLVPLLRTDPVDNRLYQGPLYPLSSSSDDSPVTHSRGSWVAGCILVALLHTLPQFSDMLRSFSQDLLVKPPEECLRPSDALSEEDLRALDLASSLLSSHSGTPVTQHLSHCYLSALEVPECLWRGARNGVQPARFSRMEEVKDEISDLIVNFKRLLEEDQYSCDVDIMDLGPATAFVSRKRPVRNSGAQSESSHKIARLE